MYYLYVMVIMALVATALWAMVCFHYVVQQQRKLNELWERLGFMLLERNNVLGDLQNIWVSPNAPPPDAHLAQLQELLAQDAATDWQAVEKRNRLRQQIDAEAQYVLAHAKSLPQFAQSQTLATIELRLTENMALVLRDADLYNRAVRLYNSLLQVNPNRIIAQWLGMAPVPLYDAR